MNAPVVTVEADRRDIPGYEGLYAVTRDGRVWAYPREWCTGKGAHIHRTRPGMWMVTFQSSRGYVTVGLSGHKGKRSELVHRLVALAWISNPSGLPQINHINGVKGDDRDENLEWCTASENKFHAHRTGLVNLDTDAFRASVRKNAKAAHAVTRKLTYEQAAAARDRIARGERKTNVAADLGIARATLRALLRGETYVQ